MWEDWIDSPVFLYSFADTQRILCVYDYDVAVLVFVVDCSKESSNNATFPRWPPNDYTRQELERMATNVVVGARGIVRLPTYAEVQEASGKVRTFSFGFRPFFTKQFLLSALDTNRQSCWPTN